MKNLVVDFYVVYVRGREINKTRIIEVYYVVFNNEDVKEREIRHYVFQALFSNYDSVENYKNLFHVYVVEGVKRNGKNTMSNEKEDLKQIKKGRLENL